MTCDAKKLPQAWKPRPIPKKLGDAIDLLIGAKLARKAVEAEAEAMRKDEKRIEDHLVATFGFAKLRGARGEHGAVTVVEKDVPKVEDKEKFARYVYENEAWDLVYGKAVEDACKERWEAGTEIDGVSKFHKVDLKVQENK